MAIRLYKLAVALGVFIVSAPAFSHGHHSHGKPLTEVEQKAANGVFDDANVQNRTLSDWDGVWQSVYPLLQSGKLDPVFQKKADADKTKTFAEIKDYYHKGYATDIEMIGIEDGIVEFHIPGRKHKKRCARRRTSCCKISTVGRNYPLPFTLLIKVERADVDPRRSASSSSFNALSTSPFATAFLIAVLK